jgi:hypothetical protein
MNDSRRQVFYVVTRDGRRTSPSDYWTRGQAEDEADRIKKYLRKWKDSDARRIEIRKTADPMSLI